MLILIAFVAGAIAGISPCILPVLPVVFFAGAVGTEAESPVEVEPGARPRTARRAWRRPLAIVAGLVVSFTVLVLLSAELLSLLHLPQGLLRDLGIAMLLALGVGFLIPAVGDLLERPFRRVAASQRTGTTSAFVIGLALGLVFVPCAGPVLATITVLGATHHVSVEAAVIALAFGAGAAVPLLFVALAGDRLVARSAALRHRAPLLRRLGGVAMILVALGVWANAFDGLQRAVPGYTSALQSAVEGSGSVRDSLNSLKGSTASHTLTSCPSESAGLVQCGPAPGFTNTTAWLNTPNGQPLTMAGLRGSVVLLDFWTYSCINCQRTLPHVEAWYSRYKAAGLVVVGVHSPEFGFEHDVGNVRTAAAQLGVHYPIAVDDAYGTWNAYANQYWPAEYLIDATGHLRHVAFGEGAYSATEQLIRALLVAAHPGISLPAATDVPAAVVAQAPNPETYLGSAREQYLASPETPVNSPQHYSYPATLGFPEFALGGTWTVGDEAIIAGTGATLELRYQANDVYLVLGGTGTLTVNPGDGTPPTTVHVSGIPRLYTLVHSTALHGGTLRLGVSPGLQAYSFTFG